MGEKTPNFPLGPALVLFGIVGVLLITLLAGQPRIPPAVPTPTLVAVVPTATTPAAEEALPVGYTDVQVRQGQNLFASTCATCHGPDAHGIPGLGKNLATSAFVHGLPDDQLLQFITVGRPVTDPLNTTGVAMPARGGNPSLTDDQLKLIIAFIRGQEAKEGQVAAAPTVSGATTPGVAATSKPFVLPITGLNLSTATPTTEFVLPITGLNLSTEEATTDAASVTAPTEEVATVEATEVTAAPTTVAAASFDAARGWAQGCAACHGANGAGGSASAVANWTSTDDQIFELLTTVKPVGSGVNTFTHPPRAGFLNLTDDQIHALIQYIHTLTAS